MEKNRVKFFNSDLEISKTQKAVLAISRTTMWICLILGGLFLTIDIPDNSLLGSFCFGLGILCLINPLIYYGIKLIMITKYKRKHNKE